MASKIYLGKVKAGFDKDNKHSYVRGEKLYLEKHKWDCGWYWGFGYIGNRNLHTHFDSTFLESGTSYASEVFEDSTFTNKEWWIIRDLFAQAYALRRCAEVYRHGGHQTTEKGTTDIIQSKAQEKKLNADLEKVLNKVWEFMTRDRTEIATTKAKIETIKKRIATQLSNKQTEEAKLDELEKELWKEEAKIN